MTTKWTKRELSALRTAVFGGAATLTCGRVDNESLDKRDALMADAKHAYGCALLWLHEMVGIRHKYSQDHASFLSWLDTPNAATVYPNSRDELRERFTKLRADTEKEERWYLKLLCKVQDAGELPKELGVSP
jgi:hypothetical protein